MLLFVKRQQTRTFHQPMLSLKEHHKKIDIESNVAHKNAHKQRSATECGQGKIKYVLAILLNDNNGLSNSKRNLVGLLGIKVEDRVDSLRGLHFLYSDGQLKISY